MKELEKQALSSAPTVCSYEMLYEDSAQPIVTSDLIVWKNPGGCWLPTRTIY
jgi:hypothetical protein